MRFIFLLFLFFFIIEESYSQDQQSISLVSIKKDSPYDVFTSFTGATEQIEYDYKKYTEEKSKTKLNFILEDLSKVRHLFDLEETPPANRIRVGDNAIAHLYDILARLPTIDTTTIPGYSAGNASIDPKDLPLRWSIPGTDIQIIRINQGDHAGEYQFSSESIKKLENYYNTIINSPPLQQRNFHSFYLERANATGYLMPDYLSKSIPNWAKSHYLNTPIWKVITISFFVFLFLLLSFIWTRSLLIKSKNNKNIKKSFILLVIPLGLLFLVNISKFLIINQINPVGDFANISGLAISITYYSILAWLSWSIVYFLYDLIEKTFRLFSKNYDESFFKLSKKLIAFLASFFVIINGADQIGIPALGLLAGFGVGGIAVALASQSTIENIFGGLSLFADRPFSIGDKIYFNKQSAEILQIGPRSTRLRTRDGALCTVPNSDLAKMHIINLSLRDSFYINQVIELNNDSPTVLIRTLLARIRERVTAEALVKKEDGWPRVRLVETAMGRIVIRIQAILLTEDYSEFLHIQEAIILDALSYLEELDLKMAKNIYHTD